LIEPYTTNNQLITPDSLPAPMSVTDPNGIIALSSAVDLQASMVSYTQVFHVMFIVTLIAMPIVFLMRAPDESQFKKKQALEEPSHV